MNCAKQKKNAFDECLCNKFVCSSVSHDKLCVNFFFKNNSPLVQWAGAIDHHTSSHFYTRSVNSESFHREYHSPTYSFKHHSMNDSFFFFILVPIYNSCHLSFACLFCTYTRIECWTVKTQSPKKIKTNLMAPKCKNQIRY